VVSFQTNLVLSYLLKGWKVWKTTGSGFPE
jgi:hypothetical protein